MLETKNKFAVEGATDFASIHPKPTVWYALVLAQFARLSFQIESS